MPSPLVGSQHLPLQGYQRLANLGLLADFTREIMAQVAGLSA